MDIDVKLITENFVEILTNTINISSLFKQIFDSEAAPDVIETTQYVYDEVQDKVVPQTVEVENISKIKADLSDTISGDIGDALDNCVKYDDKASAVAFGIVKYDNSTIKINENNQMYVDSDALGITSVPHATNADKATLADSILDTHSPVDNPVGVSVWVGSQDEYTALGNTIDSNTLYFIKEA